MVTNSISTVQLSPSIIGLYSTAIDDIDKVYKIKSVKPKSIKKGGGLHQNLPPYVKILMLS